MQSSGWTFQLQPHPQSEAISVQSACNRFRLDLSVAAPSAIRGNQHAISIQSSCNQHAISVQSSPAGPFSCSPVRCSSILQMSKWPEAAARCSAVSPACVRACTSMNAPDEAGNQHALSPRVSEHLKREAISMQLNAPRLRSPCVSSKSTSSDEPAPHASRSKFRPSNGSRHSSRQRQNVDMAAVVGAVAGVVAGVDAKAFGGGVGGGEGGVRDAVSTGTQKASTRLISASSAASNSVLISSSSSSSFVTCKMMREAIRVQSECNQSAIRVQSECNQRPSSRAQVSSPPPTCGTSRALGRSPFRAARGVAGSRRPEWRRRPWWRGKQSPPPR